MKGLNRKMEDYKKAVVLRINSKPNCWLQHSLSEKSPTIFAPTTIRPLIR
ncbi:conserved hypothetical protein [delta proteobacterium NaphS2]|nr:conserved hypothetical protein [delta proteobacterium NaphS2]